jgi:SAM-dependent methyltransferase
MGRLHPEMTPRLHPVRISARRSKKLKPQNPHRSGPRLRKKPRPFRAVPFPACIGETPDAGRIGIDRVDLPQVDIVADLEAGLPFLPDHCIDEIHCRSVLEHIENFERLLAEMMRVLKDSGRACLFVPHFSNPYYYSDYTHKRPFGLYTFYYFADPEHQPRRKVPAFYTDTRVEILSLKLKFRSPVRILHWINVVCLTVLSNNREGTAAGKARPDRWRPLRARTTLRHTRAANRSTAPTRASGIPARVSGSLPTRAAHVALLWRNY